ncbi:MAG: hypothetical protein GXO22_00305 [Aquificae bacterium]|nr:hypothetical protein [Aquificota bacterium]
MFKDEDLMKNPFQTNMKFMQNQEQSEFDKILSILTTPSKSGIYISRYDIKDLANAIGVEVGIRERKEMLKDIFIYAKQMDKLKEMLDYIINFIDYRLSQYNDILCEFPSSKDFMETWILRAEKFKALIEKMKKELDMYPKDFLPPNMR